MTTLRRLVLAVLTAAIATVFLSTATAQADEPSVTLAPLQELRTPDGWFYTLDPAEARRAQEYYHFTPTGTVTQLATTPEPDRAALHRLRLRLRLRLKNTSSYTLSISPQELRDPPFVDEGVLGYVEQRSHPEESPLVRFRNHDRWRVGAGTTDDINRMRAAGYVVDATLGSARFPGQGQ